MLAPSPSLTWNDLRLLEHVMCSEEALPFVSYEFPPGTQASDLSAKAELDKNHLVCRIFLKGQPLAHLKAEICKGGSGLNEMVIGHDHGKGTPKFSYEVARRTALWGMKIGLGHLATSTIKSRYANVFLHGLGFRFVDADAVLEHTASPAKTAAILAHRGQGFSEDPKSINGRAIAVLNHRETRRLLMEKLQIPLVRREPAARLARGMRPSAAASLELA
jgi:hypothetical protein